MKTYVGRGAGAFIENQFFAAPKTTFLLVCSPWISPKYASRIISLAQSGITVKVITSNVQERNHQEALRMLNDFVKPPRDWLGRIPKDWVPPPIEILTVHERFIHAKIYVKEGYAVVGSANLTEGGLWQNAEHIVILEGEEAEQIISDFQTLYNLYKSEEIVARVGKVTITKKIGGLLQKVKMTLRPTCPQCGRPVQRGSKFCHHCGAKLET